ALAADLASFERDQQAQVALKLAQLQAELSDELAAHRGWYAPPMSKRFLRDGHDRIVGITARGANLGQGFARGRVDRGNGLAAWLGNPLPALAYSGIAA